MNSSARVSGWRRSENDLTLRREYQMPSVTMETYSTGYTVIHISSINSDRGIGVYLRKHELRVAKDWPQVLTLLFHFEDIAHKAEGLLMLEDGA